MSRKVLVTAVILMAVALLTTIGMARATPPTQISGKVWILGATVYEVRQAGESDNRLINLSLRGKFTGDIMGNYTSESRWVVHDVGTPDAWTNFRGVSTTSPATVMGKTGTLLWLLKGVSEKGGTWVIIGGTGDLANLHGQGTYSPTANPNVVNYEGQVHFDP